MKINNIFVVGAGLMGSGIAQNAITCGYHVTLNDQRKEALERARAQAAEFGHSVEREIAYLSVHSVLHLLGYDHMDEGPMKAQMRAREEEILRELGITREE